MKKPALFLPRPLAALGLHRLPLAGFLIASAFVAGALVSSPVVASDPPLLLAPAPVADTARAAKSAIRDKAVTRERAVAVSLDAVKPVAGVVPARVGVELFDGAVAPLDLSLFEQRSPTNYTLHGRIAGSEKSQAVLTVVDGKLAGMVTLVDEGAGHVQTFSLVPTADGAYRLREIAPAGMPSDHPEGAALHALTERQEMVDPGVTPKRANSLKSAPAVAADSGAIIDVMIVYSTQTAAAAGSGIGAQLQQVIDLANVTYTNSAIATRLRLAHAEAVPYAETSSFNTDLMNLTNATGALATVPTLRDTYNADLVSLFVENGQYCGLAWIGPSANYAYSVVNRACALTNLTFVHEVGHNFGSLHEPYSDPGVTPYAYGHGYSYVPGLWRDVMSTGGDCAAAGVGCSRIAFLSNPNLTYGLPAAPLGTIAQSDNARVHNENAVTVANFRNSGDGGCLFSVAPTGVDVVAAGGTGTFAVNATPVCVWNATSPVSWLSIMSASATSGNGTLTYRVAPNTGIARGPQPDGRQCAVRCLSGRRLHLRLERHVGFGALHRRHGRGEPRHRRRVLVDGRQQCCVGRCSENHGKQLGDDHLHCRGQHGCAADDAAGHRRPELHADASGSARGCSSESGAVRSVDQVRGAESRHDERSEVGDADQQGRRRAHDLRADAERQQPGRLHP
jgi:hypothetical protein